MVTFMIYLSIILSISICNIFLNGLIVTGLVKKTSLHTPSNALLGLLCCCDLLLGILAVPYYALSLPVVFDNTYHGNFEFVLALVKACSILTGLSALLLTLVNLDRLVAICYPFKYLQYVTIKLYIIICVSIIVIYLLMVGVAYPLDTLYKSKIATSLLVAIFSITMIIVIGCNCIIFKVIRRHRREIASTERNINRQHARFQREANRYRIVVILVVIFVICQAPSIIMYLTNLIPIFQYTDALGKFSLLSDILIYLNSVLNPIVYCLRIKSFRHAVKGVMYCRGHVHHWLQ